MRFTSYLTIEEKEVPVEVEYDHIPAERGTRIDPPVIEYVAITAVILTSGSRTLEVIDLLPKAAIGRLEDEAWEDLKLRKCCPF